MFTQCLPQKQKPSQIIDLQGLIVVVGDPAGIRTQDHYIKSVMLYQLSYGIEKSAFGQGKNFFLFFKSVAKIGVNRGK